ncbi:hypothetical protein, conserved [Eimeria praecox]|uniref:Uncharacterized protein n=1 Tax=Eimeria praecox TaxID=51316 RepID=U6G5Q6_9EIME|nr:hypothetical protein, conserved [Eimeria praecox]
MATRLQSEDTLPAWHQKQEHLRLGFLEGKDGKRHRGEFQGQSQPRKAALRRKTLLPLAAFAVVTGVTLLVYMCSLSIRKRIPTRPVARRLAGRTGGEEGNESDLCSPDVDSEDSLGPVAIPAEGIKPSFHDQSGDDESVTSKPASTTDLTPVPNTGEVLRGVTTQLDTAGMEVAAKRSKMDDEGMNDVAAYVDADAQVEEAQSAPQSPLDPETDAYIDSLLSGEDHTPFDALLFSEENRGGEVLVTLSPEEDAMVTKGLAAGVSTDVVDLDSSSALSPEVWIDDGDGDNEFSDDTSLSPPVLTPVTPPGGSEDVAVGWLHEDLSIDSRMERLSTSEDPNDGYLVSGGQAGPSATVQQGSAGGVVEIPTTGMRTPADEGLGTSLGESTVGSQSSVVSAFIDRPVPLEGMTQAPPQAGGRNEQSPSSPPPLRVMGSFAAPAWLRNMYDHVPDHILQSHPFYHSPGGRTDLSSRMFRVPFAASYRLLRQSPHPMLEACRALMKKQRLTGQEFKELLHITERLVGYATGCMPKHVPKTTAAAAVEVLGIIFLVVDALFSAAEVLGENSKRSLWWGDVVRHIRKVKYSPKVRPSKTNEVALLLDMALNYYRRGVRPPCRLVVCLKEALFDKSCSMKFACPSWDGWRKDAEEWRSARPQEMLAPSNQ